MGIFRRKVPSHFVPIHRDNATSKDWAILLEANTIIGSSTERLRIAKTTLEKKVVKKFNILLRVRHFLVVEGYDPRIHALYFCPQLYRYDADKKLVPLQGEEIGKVIAQALEGGVSERRPWYRSSEKFPDEPVINAALNDEFDTVVVEMPSVRNAVATNDRRVSGSAS
jgi:rRNA-processing protein FCF1